LFFSGARRDATISNQRSNRAPLKNKNTIEVLTSVKTVSIHDTEVQRLTAVYRDYSDRNLASSKWSPANRGNQAIVLERDRILGQLLNNSGFRPLGDRRILDIGCGAGGVLADFQKWGARPENLVGVDLLAERIRAARERFPRISFHQANAEALPFPDGAFDLVLLFTALSSILNDEMRQNVAAEARRLLRPGGAIVWYDFRFDNPFNRNVRGIGQRGIRRLFPDFLARMRSLTLAPPLARRLGVLTQRLYPILARLPFLRTHYLGLLIKD
jgi:SAM-dependent methyltransferase